MVSSSISGSLAYQITAWIQRNPIERLVFRVADTCSFERNRCWQQQVAAVCLVCPASFGRTYTPNLFSFLALSIFNVHVTKTELFMQDMKDKAKDGVR